MYGNRNDILILFASYYDDIGRSIVSLTLSSASVTVLTDDMFMGN